ncbi:hypothetical protein DFH06DRAFT_1134830 [Mycena polygramma]|nr:hypothetical protein DFH06DRAFT_1134830 [Mycena polygramma]
MSNTPIPPAFLADPLIAQAQQTHEALMQYPGYAASQAFPTVFEWRSWDYGGSVLRERRAPGAIPNSLTPLEQFAFIVFVARASRSNCAVGQAANFRGSFSDAAGSKYLVGMERPNHPVYGPAFDAVIFNLHSYEKMICDTSVNLFYPVNASGEEGIRCTKKLFETKGERIEVNVREWMSQIPQQYHAKFDEALVRHDLRLLPVYKDGNLIDPTRLERVLPGALIKPTVQLFYYRINKAGKPVEHSVTARIVRIDMIEDVPPPPVQLYGTAGALVSNGAPPSMGPPFAASPAAMAGPQLSAVTAYANSNHGSTHSAASPASAPPQTHGQTFSPQVFPTPPAVSGYANPNHGHTQSAGSTAASAPPPTHGQTFSPQVFPAPPAVTAYANRNHGHTHSAASTASAPPPTHGQTFSPQVFPAPPRPATPATPRTPARSRDPRRRSAASSPEVPTPAQGHSFASPTAPSGGPGPAYSAGPGPTLHPQTNGGAVLGPQPAGVDGAAQHNTPTPFTQHGGGYATGVAGSLLAAGPTAHSWQQGHQGGASSYTGNQFRGGAYPSGVAGPLVASGLSAHSWQSRQLSPSPLSRQHTTTGASSSSLQRALGPPLTLTHGSTAGGQRRPGGQTPLGLPNTAPYQRSPLAHSTATSRPPSRAAPYVVPERSISRASTTHGVDGERSASEASPFYQASMVQDGPGGFHQHLQDAGAAVNNAHGGPPEGVHQQLQFTGAEVNGGHADPPGQTAAGHAHLGVPTSAGDGRPASRPVTPRNDLVVERQSIPDFAPRTPPNRSAPPYPQTPRRSATVSTQYQQPYSPSPQPQRSTASDDNDWPVGFQGPVAVYSPPAETHTWGPGTLTLNDTRAPTPLFFGSDSPAETPSTFDNGMPELESEGALPPLGHGDWDAGLRFGDVAESFTHTGVNQNAYDEHSGGDYSGDQSESTSSTHSGSSSSSAYSDSSFVVADHESRASSETSLGLEDALNFKDAAPNAREAALEAYKLQRNDKRKAEVNEDSTTPKRRTTATLEARKRKRLSSDVTRTGRESLVEKSWRPLDRIIRSIIPVT